MGVTLGASVPPLINWPRSSMYCRQSRRFAESQGLCSISMTMPSKSDVAKAIASDGLGGQNEVNATCPFSKAPITPFNLGSPLKIPSLA